MARGHWQIIHQKEHGSLRYGKVDTMPIEDAPAAVRDLAVRSANLVGRGLYGIDIKEVDGKFYVIEVNDNPSIDAGAEDAVLKDDLYISIMQVFRDRLDARGVSNENGR
jgi:glutathione synthase/RimK-type ligase-like ATP-grasp enzyme